jgi:LysM repeat protein
MQTKGYLWMVVSLTWCFSIYAQDREAQLEYANKYLNLAVQEKVRAGVPVSIKLGQAILESRWGTGELAVLANNHFGIKCGGVWNGPTYYKDDDEYDAQGRLIKSCFRHFDAAETSFYAHSEFLRDPTKVDRYGFLFELDPLDYKSWARGLRKAGYATDKDYHHKLIHIIESLELYRYDALAMQAPLASNAAPSRLSPRTGAEAAVVAPLAMRWIRSIEQTVDNGRHRTMVYPLALWCYHPFSDHPSRVLTYLKKARPSSGKKHSKSIPDWHRVRPNELMADISGQYGLAIGSLYHRNRLSDGVEVASGEMVKLKGGRVDKAPALRPGLPQHTGPVPSTTTASNGKADPFFQPVPKPRPAEPYYSVPVEVKQPMGVESEPAAPMGAAPSDAGTVTPKQPTTTYRYHVVKSGETLWSIARQYQLSVEQIKTMNRLYNDVIVPGVALRVE